MPPDPAQPRRLALITGASSGIGAAFARAYAARGWDLALTARRAERLHALAGELAGRHGVEVAVLPADLADPESPARLMAELGRAPDALVNNAGYGLRGPVAEQAVRDQAAFLQVLAWAPVALARAALHEMAARGYGRIVNVASVMGLIPGMSGAALYSGSKTFLVGWSEALHLETRGTGVHVTALCPGLTHTEFHEVAGMTEEIAVAPSWVWMSAERVAEAGIEAAEANRAVCVPGWPNKALVAAARLLPREWALEVVGRVGRR